MAVLKENENNDCNCGRISCNKCYRIVPCIFDGDDDFYESEEEWEEAVVDKSSEFQEKLKCFEAKKETNDFDVSFEKVWELWNSK